MAKSTPTSGAPTTSAHPRRTVVTVVVATLVVVVGVTAGIVALVHRSRESPSRSGPDAAYLAVVQPRFPKVDASDLISLEHTICVTFGRHPGDADTAEYHIASAASKYPQLPAADLASLMRAAVAQYCPQVESQLGPPASSTTAAP